MSLGAFAGGLSQGFMSGARMGKTFQELAKERGLQDIRTKAIEEATQARNNTVAGMVKEVGAPDTAAKTETSQPTTAQAIPVADPAPIERRELPPINTSVSPSSNAPSTQSTAAEMPSATPASTPSQMTPAGEPMPSTTPSTAEPKAEAPKSEAPKADAPKGLPGRYSVGDKSFETKEEALKYAGTKAPSLQDYQLKTMVPKMQEYYLGQGDVEKAEAWRSYAEKRETQKNMDTWGKAWRAASTGNYEKAADHVFDLYKSYDDGITPMSKEVVKDKSGKVTGFNVRLKNDKSGEEFVQFIDPKALTEMGLSALSAPSLFEKQYARQVAADKAKADLAKEGRVFGRQVALEGIRHNNAIEKVTIQEQLKAAGGSSAVQKAITAKVNALKSAGYSEAFINEALPGIIGIGDYKKKTSPEEAKRMAFSDRMKTDPMFGRKPADEQQRIIEQDMKLIYGGVSPTGGNTPSATGLPKPNAPAGGKGIPVYDTKTKTMIYR